MCEDISFFYKDSVTSTLRAWIYEKNGERIGIGGLSSGKGVYTILLKRNRKVTVAKRAIWRCIKLGMNMINSLGLPSVVTQDRYKECGERL